MNLPKFVFEDVPLFLGLISDLFPGLDCPRVHYPDFNDAVEQVLEEKGYVLLPVQVSRVQCHCRTQAVIRIPAQSVKCLSHKQADLSSVAQNPCKKLVSVAHI